MRYKIKTDTNSGNTGSYSVEIQVGCQLISRKMMMMMMMIILYITITLAAVCVDATRRKNLN